MTTGMGSVDLAGIDLTPNQRRSVRRRTVGWLDDGRKAVPVHKGDTEAMARLIFDAYDPELVMGEQMLVDWCPHTADYMYRHRCEEGCERPVPRIVWTARYPRDPATTEPKEPE